MIVSKVINFAIILFASMEAFRVLGLNSISDIINRFILFAGKVLGIAKAMSVDLVSGVDWNDDGNIKDHSFFDAPHFELKGKK